MKRILAFPIDDNLSWVVFILLADNFFWPIAENGHKILSKSKNIAKNDVIVATETHAIMPMT